MKQIAGLVSWFLVSAPKIRRVANAVIVVIDMLDGKRDWELKDSPINNVQPQQSTQSENVETSEVEK